MLCTPYKKQMQYAGKKISVQHLTCLTPRLKLVFNTLLMQGAETTTPRSGGTHAGRLDAIKTLMDSLIEISAIAGVAHKHAARESECISHYLAFVQLKADQALDKAGKIIMADVQEVHHA
ncbi:TPA: hypothetical protein ACG33J_003093 [Escherichia coli]